MVKKVLAGDMLPIIVWKTVVTTAVVVVASAEGIAEAVADEGADEVLATVEDTAADEIEIDELLSESLDAPGPDTFVVKSPLSTYTPLKKISSDESV
jgi:hypothetical protein